MAWPDWNELKRVRHAQDDRLESGGRDWTEAWLGEMLTLDSQRAQRAIHVPRWLLVV